MAQNLAVADLGFSKGFCSAEECKLSSTRNWEPKKNKKTEKVINVYNPFFLSHQSCFPIFLKHYF